MSVRTNICIICILAAFLCAAKADAKNYADLFKVKDVKEDVTNKTAAAAKQKAFENAQKKAVEEVLRRLVKESDLSKATDMPEDIRQEVVAEVNVTNEKTTPTRYIGTLNVNLKQDKVTAYLADSNIPYIQNVSAPMLVAVTAPDYAEIAWETLLQAEADASPVLNMLFPAEQIDTENLTTVDLFYIAERYNVKTIMMIRLKQTDTPEKMGVSVTKYDRGEVSEISAFTVRTDSAAALETLLKPAAAYAFREIEGDFRKNNVVNMSDRNVIMAKVDVSGLANWLDIEKRLKRIPLIASVDLKALKSDTVYIGISYGTTVEALEAELEKQRLELEETGEDTFVLKEKRQ